MFNRDFHSRAVICIFSVLAVILMAMPATAQDSLLISYQGYLTDDQGNPVNGAQSMTFTVYDSGDVPKWTETQPAVQVNQGYFTAVLGSETALPDSVFNGDDRYLGIAVGGDPEITPRTLFTSVASAAYSKKVEGDISTGGGMLVLRDLTGDSVIVFSSGYSDNDARIYFMAPGDDNAKKLELLANLNGSLMTLFGTPDDSAIVLRSNIVSNLASIYLMSPADDDVVKVDINTGAAGSYFQMFSSEPGSYGDRVFEIGSPLSGGANIRMVHPPEKDFMTFSSIPSTGANIKMFNPQPEPPARMFEMGVVNEGSEWSSGIDMYLAHPPEYPEPAHILSIGSSPSTGASFQMFNPQPEPPAVYFEVEADNTTGPSMSFFDDAGKVMGVEPSPWNEGFSIKLMSPGDDDRLLEISANHLTEETNIRFVHPPEKEVMTLNSIPSIGSSIKMFNPQPEPPAMIMELLSREESSEWTTGFKTYNPLGTYPTTTEIELISTETGNNFKLGNISGDMGTSGIAMTADGSAATMLMANGPGAPLSVISMSTDISSARIGIGNEAPTQPLVLGDNLGSFSGKRIIIGDATAGTESGMVMGEDNDNRGWILWNVDNDYMGMGTRETGGVYGSTLVLKAGDVGIGTNSPSEDLHVVGNICYTGTSGACSDKRYKKNISTLTGALNKVSKIRGVEFNWRKDEYPENDFSGEKQVGFIAQELSEVLPEVVSEDNNGYYNIDYGKITPLLVEAIKDQQQQIDDLTARIAELEGKPVSSR